MNSSAAIGRSRSPAHKRRAHERSGMPERPAHDSENRVPTLGIRSCPIASPNPACKSNVVGNVRNASVGLARFRGKKDLRRYHSHRIVSDEGRPPPLRSATQPREIEELAHRVFASLPAAFTARCQGLAIRVLDFPEDETLPRWESTRPSICRLYRGAPLTQKEPATSPGARHGLPLPPPCSTGGRRRIWSSRTWSATC